jgi:hypothetical protein
MSNLSQIKPDRVRPPAWDLANARKLLKGAIARAKEKNDQDALSIGNRALIYAGEKAPSLKVDPLLSAAELTVLAIQMSAKLNLPLPPRVKSVLRGVLETSSLSKKADSALGGLTILCPRDVSDYYADSAVSAIVDARNYLNNK